MSSNWIDRRSFFGVAGATGASLFLFGYSSRADAGMRFAINRSPADWKQQLGGQRYHVLREGGTERPFSSPLNNEHRRGVFICAGCAHPMFSSAAKFDSETGWPSFWRTLPGAIVTRPDHSLMMDRTEVLCARCGGHLGHVFDDGPRPTGLRYCMNGLALNFRAA